MYLPASPTARKREEEHRIRTRLAVIDGQIEAMAKVMGGGGSNAPAFPTEADIEEVGKLLVEGRLRLPRYATVTVTTDIEERKDKVFGTSTILHHTADQLCCHALQPMSIQAALERKLLVKVGGHWLFRADVYRELVPPDPRLVP